MPELPEVEVVRQGVNQWIVHRTIATVEVFHPRATRRQVGGQQDFINRLKGRTVHSAQRRGKYMWLVLDDAQAVVIHLGMSGQILIQEPTANFEKHLRIRWTFADSGRAMHFVDQRTFGGMHIEEIVTDKRGVVVPESISHIAQDPLEQHFNEAEAIEAIMRRRTEIKRLLLDQSIISGIGNIYADEALWRSGIHWATPAQLLGRSALATLLRHATEVMQEALAQGGTSFDSLYVNVNGESGYFARGLNAYGRAGQPCHRCQTLLVRDRFMNRSSFRCPKCQPLVRATT